MKCLILRCHESKAIFAHSIPVKGDDEDHYVADLIATDVAFMGHVKLLLKSDNEPALLKLAEASLMKIRVQAQKDETPVQSVSSEQAAEYESPSNGGTECGIRAVRGLFRTPSRRWRGSRTPQLALTTRSARASRPSEPGRGSS